MAWVGRKYKLDRQEKFDDYMVAIGVKDELRKLGLASVPTIYLTQNGDDYTYTSESELNKTAVTFKLGQQFEVATPDGRKVKSVVTLDGNKFTEVQSGEYPTTIVRAFTETECVTTITYNNVVSTRWYKVL